MQNDIRRIFKSLKVDRNFISKLYFYRYDDEKPIEVKFVDLQVVRYSSLVTDILYFLTTSVEPSVLR